MRKPEWVCLRRYDIEGGQVLEYLHVASGIHRETIMPVRNIEQSRRAYWHPQDPKSYETFVEALQAAEGTRACASSEGAAIY